LLPNLRQEHDGGMKKQRRHILAKNTYVEGQPQRMKKKKKEVAAEKRKEEKAKRA